MPRVTVHRKAHFNAAHRLYRKDWSDEKNFDVFSKCSNEYFHGHNYELIVSLTCEIDKKTGYVYDLGKLKNIIKTEMVTKHIVCACRLIILLKALLFLQQILLQEEKHISELIDF